MRNAVLLHQAMAKAMVEAGALAQGEIAETLAGFGALGLSAVERLSAIAGMVAAATAQRHAAAPAEFLGLLQDLTRPTSGFALFSAEPGSSPRSIAIAEATAI